MKKFAFIIGVLVVSMFLPITASASTVAGEDNAKVIEMVTKLTDESGNEILVYDTFSVISGNLAVTKQKIYPVIMVPSSTIACSETVDGVTYSGTLNLYYYHYENGKTYATYKGVLYPNS